MPKVTKTVRVNHSPEQMYELVLDVRSYPKFIKWIQSLSVRDERTEDGLYKCTGSALIGFRGLIETFSTHVVGDPSIYRIDVSLANGPFRHLRNQWRFEESSDGLTNIHFFIDYEFRNPILRFLAKSNSDLAIDRIMSAFSNEADRRYASAKT